MIIKRVEVALQGGREFCLRTSGWPDLKHGSQVDLACRAIYNASELNPVLHSTASSSCLITTVGWKTLFYTMYKLWAWYCAIAWQCHTIPIFCPNVPYHDSHNYAAPLLTNIVKHRSSAIGHGHMEGCSSGNGQRGASLTWRGNRERKRARKEAISRRSLGNL